ncbi:MAG: pyridoxal phosphate-dependent aminotransferase [Acidaminococcales bacterium]|jgi:cystathionine beta-lyase|nr:pyridoxal phosphate-dependent aminotransferase [Acidaminococcales bacterium]
MDNVFDEIIERGNTDSLKYDFAVRRGKPADVLPLWVADMDFRAPACVQDALAARARHGIFGYSDSREDYYFVLREWFKRRHGWAIKEDWLVKSPGVVFALYNLIQALTRAGEAVIIQQPVYYPFADAVNDTGRVLTVNRLVYKNGEYSIDFDDFEDKISKNRVRLFIACNPHNPVGRVWRREELDLLGRICLKHGVIVISDEVHQDFIYAGNRHLVFADINPEFPDNTVTCTAPSKTFNLAGLKASNIFIANKTLRDKFRKQLTSTGYGEPNVMGLTACKAACREGDVWLDNLLAYLAENIAFVREFVRERLPGVSMVEPEGTYLIWLDFNALGLGARELDEIILSRAKLWLDAGTMFGAGGEGFQRINIACPRAILREAFARLQRTLAEKGIAGKIL